MVIVLLFCIAVDGFNFLEAWIEDLSANGTYINRTTKLGMRVIACGVCCVKRVCYDDMPKYDVPHCEQPLVILIC